MGRQRNRSQMKEEEYSPEEELDEMEASNLSEFRVMIIRYSITGKRTWKP